MAVVVVTVTYGNRINYLNKIVNRVLLNNNVSNFIIVNNGNKQRVTSDDSRIVNISIKKNSGSANGFYQGLKLAVSLNHEYIWLLDDDNLPSGNTLDKLLTDYKGDRGQTKVFSAFRDDRSELLERGFQKYDKNSFFEFSLKNKLSKHKNKNFSYKNTSKYITCETVPYGGLLLPTSVVRLIGYPDRGFFLYNDDNDYTYRLTKRNLTILCDTDAKIHDLESSWYRRENVPMFKSIFLTEMMKSGLYTIRNRSFFELHNIVDNKLEYFFNICTYLLFVFFRYMPKNKEGLRRYLQILKMIRLGMKGKLGEIK